MNRFDHAVLALIAVLLFVVTTSSAGQRPTRVPRIGFLGLDSQMQAKRYASFEDGLRQLGYVDGQNIVIERRWAEGRFNRLPQVAKELAAVPVDVIVTAAPPAVRAAKDATTSIPWRLAVATEC